jgi:F-actin capping protein alpha subunit
MSKPEVIQELVKSAPAGKLDALLEDIQKLLGSSIDQEVLQQIKSRHEQDTCSGSTSSADHHPLALLLKQEMEGSGVRGVVVPGTNNNNDKELLLRTYAERVDEEKSRTGFWSAEWTIQTQETTAELSGTVQIGSFSFEGGNFQLRSTREFPLTIIDGGDLAHSATNCFLGTGRSCLFETLMCPIQPKFKKHSGDFAYHP